MGKGANLCKQQLLRCSFALAARDLPVLFVLVHLYQPALSPIFEFICFSSAPTLPFPEQESEKYICCPLNYFDVELELTLADPTVAQSQHFL